MGLLVVESVGIRLFYFCMPIIMVFVMLSFLLGILMEHWQGDANLPLPLCPGHSVVPSRCCSFSTSSSAVI